MKNTSVFLSNEQYSTSRGQKLTKVKNFKAHTAKNKGFFRIFMKLCSQRGSDKINFQNVWKQKRLHVVGKNSVCLYDYGFEKLIFVLSEGRVI